MSRRPLNLSSDATRAPAPQQCDFAPVCEARHGGLLPCRPMNEPYPPIEPYRTHRLQASKLHEVHVEECGNPNGRPVVFVHGGPGGGVEPWHRQFFNPDKYRIVLFDQRGCGRSTPHAELRENTTWHL